MDEAGITQSAYNYINTLVTASNVIYESEIDTHLHVHSIKLSTLYDSSTSTSEALSTMRNAYGGNNWHAPNVDLQHALLGLELGGGIAYIGSLCNTDYGFGLTAGLTGDFTSLDQRVVWDLKAFMHEIGHSFSSGHTHDTNYYEPAIDTCGTVCPSSPGNQWSTIMSYCHGCPGDYGNLMCEFSKRVFHNPCIQCCTLELYQNSHYTIDLLILHRLIWRRLRWIRSQVRSRQLDGQSRTRGQSGQYTFHR